MLIIDKTCDKISNELLQAKYNGPQESDHEVEKKREHGMIGKNKEWRKQYHVEQAISPGV